MPDICNNCQSTNPTPQYQACSDCRAYWRSRYSDRPSRSKYKAMYEDLQAAAINLVSALELIFERFPDPGTNHIDFRVNAARVAEEALADWNAYKKKGK